MKKIVILSRERDIIKEVLGIELPNTINNKHIGGTVYIDNNGVIYIDKQKVKLSKLLKLAGFDFDSTLSQLTAKWSAYFKSSNTSIKISNNLSSIYNLSHISKGTIGSSCMRYKGEFYKIFDNHPDIKIASITNKEGQLIGRAILWYNVIVHKDNIFINVMDRVYYDTPSTLELFLTWARKNNFYFKKEQNYINKKEFISPDGEIKELLLKFNINLEEAEYLPYLDTFSFYSLDKTRLYNYKAKTIDFVLDSTDGGVEGLTTEEQGYECINCGAIIREEEICYSDYYDCYLCDDCAIYSDVMSDYIILNSAVPLINLYGTTIDYVAAGVDEIEGYYCIDLNLYTLLNRNINNIPDEFYINYDDAVVTDDYILILNDEIIQLHLFEDMIPVTKRLLEDLDELEDYLKDYVFYFISNDYYNKIEDFFDEYKDKIEEFFNNHASGELAEKGYIDLDKFLEEVQNEEE